ncbi:Macrolide export ATP-binding/permease protein MacB [Planctomycetes bacterium Pan216]|uniref:Macrolide export ATP-binding/permease protein MacB n=1 Tax=Kolteria novifilia TaxID=2527975 RepID=A0A518BAE0_9BACT|nr:Macrolide export ATP-binding/permease protein MacB [Planctomycetes bacterium Pan216]
MNLWAVLNTALNALNVNKGRTALTSLGITIGIAAVIAMVAAGRGAKAKLDDALGAIGPNLVVGMSGSTTRSGLRVGVADGAFTSADADAIRRELGPMINGCSEITQFPAIASSEMGSYGTALVGGMPEVFRIRRWKFRSGRPYNEEHVKRQDKVCVIGKTVADKLFPNIDPVGKTIRAHGQRFRVIGLLEPKGMSITGADQDDIIMVPISTLLRKVMGKTKTLLIVVEARSPGLVDQVKTGMERILRERHRIRPGQDADFTINSIRDMAKLATTFANTLSGLIFAIASISLVVGGIGVMNIMLVSVTERTREIGIRMAVGARTGDVLNQFLAESVILALIGGGVGITLGAMCAWVIAIALQWDFVISVESIIVAVLTSAAVGIFFGYYPARKASMLDPIEALRYE